MAAEYSFARVGQGWGVRVWDGPTHASGDVVTVVTKNGKQKQVLLGELLSALGKAQTYTILEDTAGQTPDAKLPGPDVVPAGRYAYPVGNEWRFVKIWRKDDRVAAYATRGLTQGDKVDRREALEGIAAIGAGRAAQEFGWRTGFCGRCGDKLAVNLTRKLGIGEHCMKKMYGDETRLRMMREARKSLREAGLDPKAKYDSLELTW
jgi:hypothetical protein